MLQITHYMELTRDRCWIDKCLCSGLSRLPLPFPFLPFPLWVIFLTRCSKTASSDMALPGGRDGLRADWADWAGSAKGSVR